MFTFYTFPLVSLLLLLLLVTVGGLIGLCLIEEHCAKEYIKHVAETCEDDEEITLVFY